MNFLKSIQKLRNTGLAFMRVLKAIMRRYAVHYTALYRMEVGSGGWLWISS